MRKVTAILGAEPYFDPKHPETIKHFSDTFLNNVSTWKHDNPTDNVVILDARSYLKSETPLSDLWRDVCSSHPTGIDTLVYSGHSSPEHLLVFAHCLTQLDHSQRFLGVENAYVAPFSPSAQIYLMGCQAGGKEGCKQPDSIAQVIANKTHRKVFAHVWRTSQKEVKGRYYQKPERGEIVEFTPDL